jgi:hypothetical protein
MVQDNNSIYIKRSTFWIIVGLCGLLILMLGFWFTNRVEAVNLPSPPALDTAQDADDPCVSDPTQSECLSRCQDDSTQSFCAEICTLNSTAPFCGEVCQNNPDLDVCKCAADPKLPVCTGLCESSPGHEFCIEVCTQDHNNTFCQDFCEVSSLLPFCKGVCSDNPDLDICSCANDPNQDKCADLCEKNINHDFCLDMCINREHTGTTLEYNKACSKLCEANPQLGVCNQLCNSASPPEFCERSCMSDSKQKWCSNMCSANPILPFCDDLCQSDPSPNFCSNLCFQQPDQRFCEEKCIEGLEDQTALPLSFCNQVPCTVDNLTRLDHCVEFCELNPRDQVCQNACASYTGDSDFTAACKQACVNDPSLGYCVSNYCEHVSQTELGNDLGMWPKPNTDSQYQICGDFCAYNPTHKWCDYYCRINPRHAGCINVCIESPDPPDYCETTCDYFQVSSVCEDYCEKKPDKPVCDKLYNCDKNPDLPECADICNRYPELSYCSITCATLKNPGENLACRWACADNPHLSFCSSVCTGLRNPTSAPYCRTHCETAVIKDKNNIPDYCSKFCGTYGRDSFCPELCLKSNGAEVFCKKTCDYAANSSDQYCLDQCNDIKYNPTKKYFEPYHCSNACLGDPTLSFCSKLCYQPEGITEGSVFIGMPNCYSSCASNPNLPYCVGLCQSSLEAIKGSVQRDPPSMAGARLTSSSPPLPQFCVDTCTNFANDNTKRDELVNTRGTEPKVILCNGICESEQDGYSPDYCDKWCQNINMGTLFCGHVCMDKPKGPGMTLPDKLEHCDNTCDELLAQYISTQAADLVLAFSPIPLPSASTILGWSGVRGYLETPFCMAGNGQGYDYWQPYTPKVADACENPDFQNYPYCRARCAADDTLSWCQAIGVTCERNPNLPVCKTRCQTVVDITKVPSYCADVWAMSEYNTKTCSTIDKMCGSASDPNDYGYCQTCCENSKDPKKDYCAVIDCSKTTNAEVSVACTKICMDTKGKYPYCLNLCKDKEDRPDFCTTPLSNCQVDPKHAGCKDACSDYSQLEALPYCTHYCYQAARAQRPLASLDFLPSAQQPISPFIGLPFCEELCDTPAADHGFCKLACQKDPKLAVCPTLCNAEPNLTFCPALCSTSSSYPFCDKVCEQQDYICSDLCASQPNHDYCDDYLCGQDTQNDFCSDLCIENAGHDICTETCLSDPSLPHCPQVCAIDHNQPFCNSLCQQYLVDPPDGDKGDIPDLGFCGAICAQDNNHLYCSNLCQSDPTHIFCKNMCNDLFDADENTGVCYECRDPLIRTGEPPICQRLCTADPYHSFCDDMCTVKSTSGSWCQKLCNTEESELPRETRVRTFCPDVCATLDKPEFTFYCYESCEAMADDPKKLQQNPYCAKVCEADEDRSSRLSCHQLCQLNPDHSFCSKICNASTKEADYQNEAENLPDYCRRTCDLTDPIELADYQKGNFNFCGDLCQQEPFFTFNGRNFCEDICLADPNQEFCKNICTQFPEKEYCLDICRQDANQLFCTKICEQGHSEENFCDSLCQTANNQRFCAERCEVNPNLDYCETICERGEAWNWCQANCETQPNLPYCSGFCLQDITRPYCSAICKDKPNQDFCHNKCYLNHREEYCSVNCQGDPSHGYCVEFCRDDPNQLWCAGLCERGLFDPLCETLCQDDPDYSFCGITLAPQNQECWPGEHAPGAVAACDDGYHALCNDSYQWECAPDSSQVCTNDQCCGAAPPSSPSIVTPP